MTERSRRKSDAGIGQKARGELGGDDRSLAALEDATKAMALPFFSPIPVFP